MPLGEIHDVDIISHARSIRRVVIAAPNVQALAQPNRDLGHKRQEVVRYSLRIFADQAAFVRPDGIEVAKYPDAPGGVAGKLVAQHFLDNKLGPSIRIDRIEWVILGVGQKLRVTVDGRRRAENDALDVP